MLVPKKNTTQLRMCQDFTALNKCCPKDHFPLPRIDQIVDSTAGCERLSFLDAYSGYNQIRMKVEDEEKTAFITPYGVFCCTTMPFGLKNAGATYQRCMQACLKDQIGKKRAGLRRRHRHHDRVEATLLDDLRETFDNLDRYNIKLNPKKCAFGVPAGQLLGYLISARGIEVNPEKIQAILTMKQPKNLHGVQQLAGRVAALSRFIARLGEKALPFYQLMKKSDTFEWTAEAQVAFENLKHTLSTPPVLTTPHEGEPMLLYIAATNQVVSTALVVERAEEGKAHGVQTASLLPQRGPHPDQAAVPALPEAGLRRLQGRAQAAPLLPGAPDSGGKRGTTRQHPQQPRGYRARLHVGHRALPVGHHLREAPRHKVSGAP